MTLLHFGLSEAQWRDAANRNTAPINQKGADPIARIEKILAEFPRITTREIAQKLHRSEETIREQVRIGVARRRIIIWKRRAGPKPALYDLPRNTPWTG